MGKEGRPRELTPSPGLGPSLAWQLRMFVLSLPAPLSTQYSLFYHHLQLFTKENKSPYGFLCGEIRFGLSFKAAHRALPKTVPGTGPALLKGERQAEIFAQLYLLQRVQVTRHLAENLENLDFSYSDALSFKVSLNQAHQKHFEAHLLGIWTACTEL